MKINSAPARTPQVRIWVISLALFTSGCATGPLVMEEKQSPPEPSFVKAQPVAESAPKVSDLASIVDRQKEEIEKNDALLERQRQEIQRLKVRLGEY